jgi:hypothetical protein
MLRVSTEKMRVSTEKLHICTEKRLSVTEQQQYSTEKFDFHGITTRLYGEGARFYGEGLALMGRKNMYPFCYKLSTLRAKSSPISSRIKRGRGRRTIALLFRCKHNKRM